MGFGAPELIVVLLIVLVLFGYKKLPDASRALGRSLRIFKGEMKGMKDDDVRTKDAARTTPVSGEIVTPPVTAAPPPARDADLTAHLQAEARDAEVRAAEARERAERARSADTGR
jgi:sec-independent protein translocase protein TatA